MIEDFAFDWGYWTWLLASMFILCYWLKIKLLDFPFFVLLILVQYVLHSYEAFGNSEIFMFCLLFLLFFVLALKFKVLSTRMIPVQALSMNDRWIQQKWASFSRYYLLVYYLIRFATYPIFSGELFLDDRLVAQQENKLVFMLGLAVTPALASCMFDWIRRDWKLSLLECFTLGLVVLGLLGGGSKGSVFAVVATYIGAASMLGKSPFKSIRFFLIGAALAIVAYVALLRFFPQSSGSEIIGIIQYRVAANTDSLEYIYANGVDPRQFPFAGVGALFPLIFKRLGYAFDYSPGVWLYGWRYEDWLGFGPNSGIVMDYFGNLGWLGPVAAIFIGWYVGACIRNPSIVKCAFLGMALMLVVDIAIFDIQLLVWGGVYTVLWIARPVFGRGGRLKANAHQQEAVGG